MTAKVKGLTQLETGFRNIGRAMPGAPLAEALEDGASIIVLAAQDNVLANDLVQTLELHDSIHVVKVNQSRVDIEVGAVHGAAHEFGLEDQPITDLQRAFFWAKFMETGDPMWKALALSQTYTIPAQPYLRPAVDSEKFAAAQQAARSIEATLKQILGG